MFLALHGTFVPHAWVRADGAPPPDYLLRDRTAGMSWGMRVGGGVGLGTTQVREDHPLWTVLDAGPDVLDRGDAPIAWFHAEVQTSDTAPLPARAFLVAGSECVSRLGELELTAVQLLAPVGLLDPVARTAHHPQVDGQGWWRTSAPSARTPVLVSLTLGQAAPPPALDDLVDELTALDQDVARSIAPAPAPSTKLPFVFSHHLWPGPPGPERAFHASLPEWSPDAVGWFVALLGDVLAGLGVRTPALLTVARRVSRRE